MIGRRNRPTGPLTLPNTPVLIERSRSLDRRSIRSYTFVNIVGSAVGGDGALVGKAGGWVVGSVAFEDVVFHERRGGPAVDGEVGVSVRLVVGRVGDGPA